MSGPSEWAQYYHQQSLTVPQTSDATTVTIHGNSSGATQLSPEGRVTKPARRRSRASRRTPTTLLNTDTTNFRAMVQQFTGGPSAPFGHHHHPPAPTTFSLGQLGLGIGGGGGGGGAARLQAHPMPPAAAATYRLQYNQNQQPWMISLSNNQGGDHHEGANMSADGFVVGNVTSSSSSSHLPSGPGPASNQNRGSTFMF